MRQMGSSFALMQDLSASRDRRRGFSMDMHIFLDTSSSAVIVNDVNVEAAVVLASSCGFCVCVEGPYGLACCKPIL